MLGSGHFGGVTPTLVLSYTRSPAGEFELRTGLTNFPAESKRLEDPLWRPRSSTVSRQGPSECMQSTGSHGKTKMALGVMKTIERSVSRKRHGRTASCRERRRRIVLQRLILAALFSVHQPHPIPKLLSGRPEPTRQRYIGRAYTFKTPSH